MKEIPLLFAKTKKKILLDRILLLDPNDKTGKYPVEKQEIIVSNRLITWLLFQVVEELDQEEQKELMDVVVSYLSNKKHSEGTLSILLNVFNHISRSLDLTTVFKNDQDFTDTLMPFIKCGRLQIQIPTCEIFKTVSQNTPEWVHPLISTLISHTSITHAELAGLSFTPVYAMKLVPQVSESYPKEDIQKGMQCLNQVNCLAHALALVFSSVNHSLKGVPVTLSNSSFNAAKAMILGNFQTEDDEEDIIQVGLEDFDISDSPRREAGWVLLEGLLHLGSQWVGSKVNTIYKLWNSVFYQDMCEIDVEKIKNRDVLYIEKILTEFKIKKQALSTIKCFLNKCYPLLNSQLIKLTAGFVVNAITFFINQEKKEIVKLFQKTFHEDFLKVRSDIYECLSNLHPSLYSYKFVHILHSVTDDIVNESITKSIPSVATKTLCKEDQIHDNVYLHSLGVPESYLSDDVYFDSSSTLSGELLDLTLRHSPWFIVDTDRMNTSSSDLDVRVSIRENAIQTFSDIFVSSQLNDKNKIQLSNHLLLHAKRVQASMPSDGKGKKNKQKKDPVTKERKIAKLSSIGSAAYMIALGMVKKKVRDVDQAVFGNLESVFTVWMEVDGDVVGRICAEGLALLYTQVTGVEYLMSIISLKNFKQDLAQKDSSSKSTQRHEMVLGNILRYNDLEEDPGLNEAMLEACTNILTSKDTNSKLKDYLSTCENEEILKHTYPICFYLMQMDIVSNSKSITSMCKFTERILRYFQVTTDTKSKVIIVFKEFINHFLAQAFSKNASNTLIES